MSSNLSESQKPLQKLISFNKSKIINEELQDGWGIVSLIENEYKYVDIIEQIDKNRLGKSVYIPPRKKIRFKV